ncbi:MAG TPA: ABC transporter ATP-binding protein [Candidatus Babeliales bacterium]|nr:ABC transporter ATP-binding protein [Candidatus Babeliales bacterium]
MNKQTDSPLPNSFFSCIKWAYAPYKTWIAFFILCAGIAGLYYVVYSYLLKLIVDSLNGAYTGSSLTTTLLLPTILFVLNYTIYDLSWKSTLYIHLKISPLIKNKLISALVSYVHQQPYSFSQKNPSGSIAHKINILVDNIEKISYEPTRLLIRGSVQLITAVISTGLFNIVFSLGLLIWPLLFISISLHFSNKIKKLSRAYADAYTTTSGIIVDSLANTNSVRIFARREFEQNNLTHFLNNLKERFRTKEYYLLKYTVCQGLSVIALLTFTLFFLVRLKSQNLLTVGDFIFILTLILDVADNLWSLTEQIDIINDSIGKCNQSLHALLTPLEIQDEQNALPLHITNGKIEFNHVFFEYDATLPLFKDINILIPPGHKLGLVGYSGSGKSTFAHLLLRLFDTTSGSIVIDNQSIKTVTQDSLRANIGMILQDLSLLNRSIMENIRYGNPNATDDEVIDVAKKVAAHDFIIKLPNGYDTIVGEHGNKLSGGQRQRILIARVILKNAPILILDEATSQLDSLSEIEIKKILWTFMEQKTTIVIAHRLLTLLHMDRILVFQKGAIVGDGTHQELLENCPLYKTMWETQINGFLPEKIISPTTNT